MAFNRAEWLAFIAMAVTLGPVAEETFYRGFLYNALRQRLHPIPAALIQAVVFGCVHPFGLANSVGIGVAAVALAVVYEWRKTLLTPILVHAAMNAVGMVLLSGVLAAEADAPPDRRARRAAPGWLPGRRGPAARPDSGDPSRGLDHDGGR